MARTSGPGGSGRTDGNQPDLRRRHLVLIVDDDPDVRDLYVETLREIGHGVKEAPDGEEAIRMLTDGEVPCVILTDVRMPRMDGFELSRALGKDPELSALPVVLITGDRLLSYTTLARDKPMSPEELDALVQASCRLHRAPGRFTD
jgi:CheY-like chemotaxis protein